MARTERPMARYQDKISDVQGAKHSYELLGVPIGEKCLPQLLGTSRNRLHKCMQGCPGTRYGNKTGLRIQPKTDSVDAFLLSVYISQGQCLPDRCPLKVQSNIGRDGEKKYIDTYGGKSSREREGVNVVVGSGLCCCSHLANTQISGPLDGLANLTNLEDVYPPCVACGCCALPCKPHRRCTPSMAHLHWPPSMAPLYDPFL